MPNIPKPPKDEKYDSAANDWMAGKMEDEIDKEKLKGTKPVVKAPPPKRYARGGMTGARGDGCCTKGKTKGRVV